MAHTIHKSPSINIQSGTFKLLRTITCTSQSQSIAHNFIQLLVYTSLLRLCSVLHSTLEEFGFDLDTFIRAHPSTTLSYGSELRPLDQLEPLLRHHPTFPRFSCWHTHGISYPVDDLDE